MAHAGAAADRSDRLCGARLHGVRIPAGDQSSGGSRQYFVRELRALGAMSVPEKWGLSLFAVATLLAFTRQLYATRLPGLTPAFAFLAFGYRASRPPQRRASAGMGLAQTHMVWGLIYLFAGGSALGQILSETGTALFLAERLVPLAGGGGFFAVVVFSFLTIVITQITSNTATIAIVVPITISTFERLGLNPIPFVYIVAAAGNYGLMLPSSSAGPAMAAGYGVNLTAMFSWGAWLTGLIWVLLVGIGYLFARFGRVSASPEAYEDRRPSARKGLHFAGNARRQALLCVSHITEALHAQDTWFEGARGGSVVDCRPRRLPRGGSACPHRQRGSGHNDPVESPGLADRPLPRRRLAEAPS